MPQLHIPNLGWDHHQPNSLCFIWHHLCHILHLELPCLPQNPCPEQGYVILSLQLNQQPLYPSHAPWGSGCDLFDCTPVICFICRFQRRNGTMDQLQGPSCQHLYRTPVISWSVALRIRWCQHRSQSVVMGYLCFAFFCLLRLFWWSHKALSLCHEFSWELCFFWEFWQSFLILKVCHLTNYLDHLFTRVGPRVVLNHARVLCLKFSRRKLYAKKLLPPTWRVLMHLARCRPPLLNKNGCSLAASPVFWRRNPTKSFSNWIPSATRLSFPMLVAPSLVDPAIIFRQHLLRSPAMPRTRAQEPWHLFQLIPMDTRMILFRIFDSLYFSVSESGGQRWPPCVYFSRFFSAVALVLRFVFLICMVAVITAE